MVQTQPTSSSPQGQVVGDTGAVLLPLVLTGGPAVGKSTTAGALARARERAAVVDVDDVEQ